MLTLKAPLELKCNPAMISSHEAFYHRITGNYGLLSSGINREDLLHVVTAPLELYLEEGGGIQIAENTRIQNSQETKLEIINNFLNRIAVMEEANLTYQDRVFITDVLNKLGIREVERFMGEVFRLKQETRTTERLISLYWNHLEELKDRVEAYHSRERERQTVEERTVDGQERIALYQEILDRLQTGAIYQIQNNFQLSHSGNSRYVTRQELQVSEQKRVAVQILLQKLRQEVRGEALPLVYRHEDGYRQSEPEEESAIEAWVGSQISSSVLLNLIDNLYLSLFERQQHRADLWLSMEDALYQSAENTLYRLKTGFHAQWQVANRQNLWNIRQQQLKGMEIHLAQALLEAGWEAQERFTLLWNQYGEQTWQLLEDGHRSAEIAYGEGGDASREELLPGMPEREKADGEPMPHPAQSGGKGAEAGGDSRIDAPERAKGTEQPRGRALSKKREEELAKAAGHGKRQRQEQESGAGAERAKAEIHFLPGEAAIREELPPGQPVRELIRLAQESREQFYRVAQQYLSASRLEYRESMETFRIREDSGLLEQITERLGDVQSLQEMPGEKDRELAQAAETVLLKWQPGEQEQFLQGKRAEASRAEEPGNRMAQISREATGQEASRESVERFSPQEAESAQAMEILHRIEAQENHFYHPEEGSLPGGTSKEESAEALEQQIRQINQQNLERLERFREMQKELAPGPGRRPAAQRDMRRDSLKALQDPQGLLREYEEERRRAAQEEQGRAQKLMELLPVQTRRVYERLEEYLGAQRDGAPQGPQAQGAVRMLLRDIRQAQTVHRETEQTREEELRRIQESSETVLERWGEAASSEAEAVRTLRQEQEKSRIALFHKSTQQQIDQEMLESLMEQNRTTQGKRLVDHEEVQDRQTVSRTVHQQTQQVVNRETEDITEMIQKGVRQQMGELSEQIYSRLEKRLQNEKKRRGY